MNLEGVWTRGAESDLLEIFSNAEDFSPGSGERLVHQTGELVSLLQKQPYLGRLWCTPVRKVNIRRSGLGLFYAVESRRLIILAVLGLHRSQAALLDEIRRRLP